MAGKRKKLLTDMGSQMAAEVRKDLATLEADAAAGLVQTKLTPLLDKPADAFNVDVHFQSAVAEALKTKRSVQLATALQTPGGEAGGLAEAYDRVQRLQGNVVDLSGWDLTEEGSADSQLVVAWMASGPGGLTRLVLDAPKACAAVVDALHALVAQTQSLVDLDVMEKNAANLNVLRLNGVEPVESIDESNKKYGPVSAAIIAACVRVNRTVVELKCAAPAKSVTARYPTARFLTRPGRPCAAWTTTRSAASTSMAGAPSRSRASRPSARPSPRCLAWLLSGAPPESAIAPTIPTCSLFCHDRVAPRARAASAPTTSPTMARTCPP